MYRTFTAEDFLRKFPLGDDYQVSGFLVFGTFKNYPYELLRESLKRLGYTATFRQLPGEFLSPILEFRVKGGIYWFVKAYGGALLCEWLHLACLFGSKKNIVLGSCGGLHENAQALDVVVPPYSLANESTTRAYEPGAGDKHHADSGLRKAIVKLLEEGHRVWDGPTVTNEAMLAETLEDVQSWSRSGFYGVEMEAATVFAVSNHFKVPSAAALAISDNLIKGETTLDENFQDSRGLRRQVFADMMDVALRVMIKNK
ncbi:MAG: hypothetical protein HYS57_02800 [Parcubacteria group bacterium]|nr:hypothetical protein [Parcubacteria group bacterium]